MSEDTIEVTEDVMESLFRPKSWYKEAYYSIRRFFKYKVGTPAAWYRRIKWFIQRGHRGWADCDTWSLDHYLNSWMPKALAHLKKYNHGVPCEMFDSMDEYDSPSTTDSSMKIAIERWDTIMNKMIEGFKASKRIVDGLYEEELGPYPLRKPAGITKEAWRQKRDDRFKESRKLEARDEALRKEGMGLFVEHYHSLWD